MIKVFALVLCIFAGSLSASELPVYTKNDNIKSKSYTINSVGSDTLAGLLTFWSEGFQKFYPNVKFQIQAAGSSTGPVALIEGTTDIAPMSREMKSSEIDSFQKKYGYPPTKIAVAIDALGIFVNKSNPLNTISIVELDGIFSANQACGGKSITSWTNLGVNIPKANIAMYGRNSVSGTYAFFKDVALCKGDFRTVVNEQPGSSSVIQSIGKSPNAIGYSSVGHISPQVKLLSVAGKRGKAVLPSEKNIASGIYPLARLLYIYVNKKPDSKLNPVVEEFFRFILSQQGQKIVAKDGFTPLNPKLVSDNIVKLK